MGTRTGAAAMAPGGGRRWALALPFLVAVAGLLLTAAPALASFHFMKIREVYTGGASGGSYVELQMWTGGQNFVNGHPIVVYNPNGAVAHTFPFAGNVDNGSSQATILVAGPGYATTFPSGPAPDATDSELDLPAAGGAVCFTQAEPPDCVAWGNFTGAASLPSATGTPASAGGVTAGKALHRSTSASCATLLEPGDDTNNSAADFSEQNPNPRNNASAIVEASCSSSPNATNTKPAKQQGAKSRAPQTVLRRRPPQRSRDRTPTFRFDSAGSGVNFECKLDRRPFKACRSPFTARRLSYGLHSFRVRARNATGQADPTPALDTFRIVRRLS